MQCIHKHIWIYILQKWSKIHTHTHTYSCTYSRLYNLSKIIVVIEILITNKSLSDKPLVAGNVNGL